MNTEALRGYLLTGARSMGLPLTVMHATRLARHVATQAAQDGVLLGDAGITLPTVRRQVLIGLARGETVGATARRLHMHVDTVKRHRTLLYEALDVSTGTAAVAAAYRYGLLEVPDHHSQPEETPCER